jgi:lysophospholipase L1-like esterase
VTNAFADVIASLRKDNDAADANAMSGALVAMLAHTAAHQDGFESWDIHVRELRRALADLVYWGATGRKPPR